MFGGALIVAGIFWLFDEAGILRIRTGYIAPIVLIAIGVLLVAASNRRGTRTWLIVAGAILTAVLASDSAAVNRFGDGADTRAGDNVERPVSGADIHPYRLGAGKLTVDLTYLVLKERTYTVEARVGAGTIRVLVPAGVPVRVEARSGGGTLQAVGNRRSGVGVRLETEMTNYSERRPRIDLHLRAGVGSIYVTRERSRAP